MPGHLTRRSHCSVSVGGGVCSRTSGSARTVGEGGPGAAEEQTLLHQSCRRGQWPQHSGVVPGGLTGKIRGTQKIIPRKMFNTPAIQRALTRSELTVATQLFEITDPKMQLRRLGESPSRRPRSSNFQALKDGTSSGEIDICTPMTIQDLEIRNQKLQISVSDAEAGLNRHVRNPSLRRV